MTDLIGTRLSQYELKDIIRSGGMSTVYKGYQDSLDRFVAVKVLFANRDPQFAVRFKREARAIAALQHHNILPVYDYGEKDDLLFLVMQYIENGTTLGDMLGQPIAAPTALRLTSHVLDALEYAHQRGVIHRDIKPANVLMPSPKWPMLADFGIAKLMNDTQQRLTMANHIIGTAAYMAPEQATGRPIDARTDLYAAGVVLYELVTGRVPFDSDTPMAMLTAHIHEIPPPPRSLNPNLPPAVEAVLLRALEKDPNARYQTAAEMSAELSRIANQLDLNPNTGQVTGLYSVGVRAFEEGRWDEAVDQLGRLVSIDPQYEDATDLLDAARAAQNRARTEARQQIDLVRQRRQSGVQQLRPAIGSTTVSPVTDASATRVPPRDEHALATTAGTPAAHTSATRRLFSDEADAASFADPNMETRVSAAAAPIAPAAPAAAPVRRLPIVWIVAGLVVVALVGALLFIFFGKAMPTSIYVAQTVLPTTGAAAPTSAAAAPTAASTGQLPTSAPVVTAPTGTQAVAAPPPAGQQVYSDDFNDPRKSGLENQTKAPDFERGIHPPGVYHLRVLAVNDTRVELLARQAYQDFSLQIDLNDNSDDFNGSVSQGLIFRARDRQHYYAWLIDPRAGKYSLRRQDGDKATELIPWTDSDLIKLQKDVNQLRVDGTGGSFTAYLNGAKLAEVSDPTYSSGMIGFIVANVDAQLPHMHFDNLAIWSTDAAPVASGLPTQRKDANGDMLLIRGGEFILGSNDNRDEPPQMFQLTDFYIDRAEVTNALYRACVAASTCTPLASPVSQTHPDYANQPNFDQYPVINVSWQQASAFCGWAGKRLPSEAEWEKAASWDSAARQKFVWPWSNDFDPKRANSDEAKVGDTTAIGSYPPELNGTVDIAGNVSEWTNSLFRPYPYNEADGREDAKSPDDRVYRGGSWAQTEGKARGIYRVEAKPDGTFNEVGFRCAATP